MYNHKGTQSFFAKLHKGVRANNYLQGTYFLSFLMF